MRITAPTPYVTPDILKTSPTGITWSTIPTKDATDVEKTAELFNICQRASAEVDEYANGIMRATVDAEPTWGPGDARCQLRPDGTARIMLTQWPLLQVLSGRYSASASFPRNWTSLTADDYDIERPLRDLYTLSASGAGDGGLAVFLRPGVITWRAGRQGTLVETTYVSGWPHASLTSDAVAGDTTIDVDDCTGWVANAGANGVIYDATGQEAATVTQATSQTGPGTLTLSAPLVNPHDAGALFTTLPESVQWATILFAAAEALTRGATSTTMQQVPGINATVAGDQVNLRKQARDLLSAYRRAI